MIIAVLTVMCITNHINSTTFYNLKNIVTKNINYSRVVRCIFQVCPLMNACTQK